jgi:hypothetical protein
MTYTAHVQPEGKRFADENGAIRSPNDGKRYVWTRNVGRISAPQVPNIGYVNRDSFLANTTVHDTYQL